MALAAETCWNTLRYCGVHVSAAADVMCTSVVELPPGSYIACWTAWLPRARGHSVLSLCTPEAMQIVCLTYNPTCGDVQPVRMS